MPSNSTPKTRTTQLIFKSLKPELTIHRLRYDAKALINVNGANESIPRASLKAQWWCERLAFGVIPPEFRHRGAAANSGCDRQSYLYTMQVTIALLVVTLGVVMGFSSMARHSVRPKMMKMMSSPEGDSPLVDRVSSPIWACCNSSRGILAPF